MFRQASAKQTNAQTHVRQPNKQMVESVARRSPRRSPPLANGGGTLKIDCTLPVFLYYIYITWCCFQVAQDGSVITISLECLLLVISGKSLFVKILVNRLIITGKRIYLIFNTDKITNLS